MMSTDVMEMLMLAVAALVITSILLSTRLIERFILNYTIKNADRFLGYIKDGEPREREKVRLLFRFIAWLYCFSAVHHLLQERKRLLSDLLLANITPPSESGSGGVIQSRIRHQEAKDILLTRILANRNPAVFGPALEAMIELLAAEIQSKRKVLFWRYFPLLEASETSPFFARKLIDTLVKAKHEKVTLFFIKDRELFFRETRKIIKALADHSAFLRRNIVSYLFEIVDKTEKEIPLVQQLLSETGFHVVGTEEFARLAAGKVAEKIIQLQKEENGTKIVTLVLTAGRTMVGFLRMLAIMPGIDWERVHIFQSSEYKGLSPDNQYSFAHFFQEHLVSRISIPVTQVHYINGANLDQEYVGTLNALGGADIAVVGVGLNGHVAFNEPEDEEGTRVSGQLRETRLVDSTIRANVSNYPGILDNPFGYCLGLLDLLAARNIFLFAEGKTKARIIKEAVSKPLRQDMPVSLLLSHPTLTVVLDKEAVDELTHDFLERYAQAIYKLHSSEAQLRELFENAPVGIHEIDQNGIIVMINQTEAALLGYTVDDMLGSRIWDFVSPPQRDVVYQAVAQKLSKPQELKPFERIYQRKNGTAVWVRIHDQQLIKDGKVKGILSTVQDITEQKRNEQALLQRIAELEAKLAGKSQE